MIKLFLSTIVLSILIIVAWFYFMGNGSWGSFGQFGSQNAPQTATLQKPKLFEIGNSNNPITVLATTLPQFALDLANGKYSNIWVAHAQEQQGLVKAQAVNEKGDANLTMTTQFDSSTKQLVVTPVVANSFQPGMYQLTVKVKTVTGKDITITQNFAWGVLAINTNKAIYQPGDSANIGMTVLDDVGTTKCIALNGVIVYGTAKVALTVTSPSGKVVNFSTDAGTITGSPSCKDRSYSDSADFLAKLNGLSAIGKYKLHMEATTVFGTRSIDSFFTVQATPPAFDIQRVTYPTRIYPRYNYPVTVDVTPSNDYSGTVYDIVPSSFDISAVSGGGIVIKSGEFEKIQWQVNWQAGQLQTLSYTIHFPQVSPEFYLVGPLTIGNFTEGNEWQIASDSLFGFIQEANGFAASGSSLTINMPQPVGQGTGQPDLLVMNCYKVSSTNRASSVFTSSNNSGWSRAYDGGQRNDEYAGQYYRVVSGSEIGVQSMTCNAAGVSTGEIAMEVMEYDGNALASPHDTNATFRSTAVKCTTTADIMNTLTPTNPDELVVTQFVSLDNTRTPTSHTTETGTGAQGFTDNNENQPTNLGFQGSSNSYDSAWGEVVGGDGRDTVIWTGGTTSDCYNGGAAYLPTISISQGSYQFFLNQDSLIPGLAQGGKNTLFSLTSIGEPFRLRMLLEVDATGTLNYGLQSLDLELDFAPLPQSGFCSDVPNGLLSNGGGWTTVATVGAQMQTDIAWNQNPLIATSGAQISATANDPTDTGYSNLLESYYQDDFSSQGPNDGGVFDIPGDITNDYRAIANNQAGEWDFSLVDNSGGANEGTYCLQLATTGGGDLSAYRQYPEVTFAKAGVVIRGSYGETKIKGSGGASCIGSNHVAASCGTKIK